MRFTCKKQMIEITDLEPVVSGTVGEYNAEFAFDDCWDGYTKFAVFQIISGQTYQVALENDACIIPWEVLAKHQYLSYNGLSDERPKGFVNLGVAQCAATPGGMISSLSIAEGIATKEYVDEELAKLRLELQS